MRIAILGAGGWGKNHVRTFCSILGSESILVCDPDSDRLRAAEEAHPGIGTSAEPIFRGVDAVVIAAPAVHHHELAAEALNAGCHVLVEKPMTLTSDTSEELVRLAEEKQRILMVDHLLEYHPAVLRLKELVTAGELGRLLHLTSRRLNLGVIRTEENALWSLAPHDISVILFLLDEEPAEVIAQGATYLQPGIPDVAYLTMRFSSGALAHIHASWLDPVKTRALSVVGDRRMAIYDDTANDKLVLFNDRAVESGGRFAPDRGGAEAVELGGQEPLTAVAEAFLESINTGVSPTADGLDGLRVVRVLEAAQASMDADGKAVRIGGGA